jgi:hypothetical protein
LVAPSSRDEKLRTRFKPVRPPMGQANYSSAQTTVCANEFGTG